MPIIPKQTKLDDDAYIYQEHKQQTEREKLQNMSFQDKLSYLWDYYKLQALAIVAVIALIIYFIYNILHPDIVPRFYAAMINNTISQDVLDKYNADFSKHLKLDSKRESVIFNNNFNFTMDDTYSANMKEALTAYISNHEVDVIIAPKSYFRKYAYYGFLNKLSDKLPTDVYSALTDKFYEANTQDNKKEKDVYGIYLSDTALYKKYANNTDPYILGIVAGSKHEDNTIEFIRYLFHQK